jgi:peptidyl-prolyl cis-trans isomerase B (cyclophilin B)
MGFLKKYFCLGNVKIKELHVLVLKTNQGDITIELFETEAPISTRNFLDYAEAGFYEGTIFHRVIDGFMVQGGGFTEDMQRKETGKPIKNEAGNGLKNKKYTLAMARTSVPDSATSQFFINTADNSFLDRDQAQDGVGYAVFGKVVEGTEVVDQISKAKTGARSGMGDVPVEAIVIQRVEALPE